MATSTERTVRDAIVAAIRGIAQSDLGFDSSIGNIHDYSLDSEIEEKRAAYLTTSIDGQNTQRAWSVEVLGFDEIFALGGITKRTYEIVITGYYLKVGGGDDVNLMIDHATKIRGAIKALTVNLGGTATLLSGATGLEISERDGLTSLPVFVGKMTYRAERTAPDF